MAGIYIHIPFCKRKCVYCDFYSTAGFDRHGKDYLSAAVREMEASAGYLGGEAVRTLYFGGGTPSLYSAEDIEALVTAVKSLFPPGDMSEITLEANPEDLTAGYLAGLKEAGINRLSIGIQSFDDSILTFMKRRHNGARAKEVVRLAREAGFDNISIDLIYGIPGLAPAAWEETLDTALSLKPEHISAYHLTFEPGTTLGRWRAASKVVEVTDEESRRHFEILRRKLSGGGYEHYEISNFALPGCRSLHNSSYWTGAKYLGIGPGAHSFNGNERRWCEMSVAEYVEARIPIYGTETLTAEDRYNELVMTSLRCSGGVSPETIASGAGAKYADHFIPLAESLRSRDLLRYEDGRYCIDPSDFLVSDTVIAELFI